MTNEGVNLPRVTNRKIADIFNEIADLLDIDGDNPFKVRAYRNAARTILGYSREMSDLVEEGFDLTSLRGIGKELAKKITEIVQTGKLAYLEKLRKTHPPQLEELLKIPGLGPGRVRLLHELLLINSLEDLEKALREGKLEKVPGFGDKLIAKIENGIQTRRYEAHRFKLSEALPVAEWIIRILKKTKGAAHVEIAGSLRRRKETVHDIDLVAACEETNDTMVYFLNLPKIQKIVMKGTTRSTILLENGMSVDLRVVPLESFGATLHHFTGSKAHNITLRKMAVEKGLKINEYGIWKEEKRIGGEREQDIYDAFDMQYIEPEMRENRGEITLAQKHALPKLITQTDIRGDLHMHTSYSDGLASIEEMAQQAKALGYEYIAITDHTEHLKVAHGMDEKRVRAQLEEVDALNEKLEGITILKSAEVDILEDGSLDMPKSILEALDLTVCSVHTKFNLSREKQTQRILKAMDNPHFTILAHPTGRLIGLREPYALDMEAVMQKAKEKGCILELNAQPDRLDLNDIHCKMAKQMGVHIAISTDAHSLKDLELMRYGIWQARRGWLGKENVVNTLSLSAFQTLLGAIKS